MGERYDVVIVGAGSAGCILADRLSLDPRRRVLLIEAGPDGSTPATRGDSFFDAIAEPGRTYPEMMVHRTREAPLTHYLLGRGLGGSSAVNGMIATIGVRADYDRWARELGCPGWAYNDVEATFAGLTLAAPPANRDALGPVDRALIRSARALGHAQLRNPFAGEDLGAGPAALARYDGRRITSADHASLDRHRDRSNLAVRTDTCADRILLAGRVAVGVELAGGEVIDAQEVVLAAGAIHSPLLLLRSQVERSGIGVGLKDHPSATFTLCLNEPADTSTVAAAALLRWSSPGRVGDLQTLSMNHVGVAEYGALVVGLMAVHSSGSIELVEGTPLVRFDMLSDERDLVRLRDAARHVAEIARSPDVRAVAETVVIDGAGTPMADLEDDTVMDAWLHTSVGAYVHASSTCRMGPRDDPSTVVDTHGRVHGYMNLRVCDASIFPDIPTANLYLPTMMLAEQISKVMIEEW